MKKLFALLVSTAFLLSCSVAAFAKTTAQDDPRLFSIDPEIRATVEEGAPNAERWWNWFFDLPLESEEGVNQTYLLEWLGGYAPLTAEEKEYVIDPNTVNSRKTFPGGRRNFVRPGDRFSR